jgi:hypothetical protein
MNDKPTPANEEPPACCPLPCPHYNWITSPSAVGPVGMACAGLGRKLVSYENLGEDDQRPAPPIPEDCPGPPRCAWCGDQLLRMEGKLVCANVDGCPAYKLQTPWEAVGDIAERAVGEAERLGALLQAIESKLKPDLGPAIIIHPGPFDEKHYETLNYETLNGLFNDGKATSGTLRDRLIKAGFKLIQLPPGVYGALDGSVR